ncbi:hypothetical protein B5P43_19495 [Bacillus sp. SRB_336]|nr:hypothetical protein B5P43_19495 [Bacillus sp. SRB_336]
MSEYTARCASGVNLALASSAISRVACGRRGVGFAVRGRGPSASWRARPLRPMNREAMTTAMTTTSTMARGTRYSMP